MFSKKQDAELKEQNRQIIGLLTTLNENLNILASTVHHGYPGGRRSYIYTGNWDGGK